MLLIWYPKCSTCRKAKAWLDEHGIRYDLRDIKENPPTLEELELWQGQSGLALRKWFNTSGQLYRGMGLKDRLPHMTEGEQLELLASDGMLVKRPILVDGHKVLLGFRAETWAESLL